MNKIESAIKILKLAEQQAQQYNEPVEIAYSGGKDSDVLLQLAKESGINYRAIYKNTTIDPVGTIKHVKDSNVEIVQPKRNFKTIIEAKGFPSRWFRFCCAEIKEYKILNVVCLGVRQDESIKRRKFYKNFEKCRIIKGGKLHQYSPIYNWSLPDIKQFIESRELKLAPVYYTNGLINYNKRLGCLGCPLKADAGKQDFKENKNILLLWLRAGQKYLDTHPHTKCAEIYNNNVYNMFYAHIFCKHTEEYKFKTSNNLFGKIDLEKDIKQYFNL